MSTSVKTHKNNKEFRQIITMSSKMVYSYHDFGKLCLEDCTCVGREGFAGLAPLNKILIREINGRKPVGPKNVYNLVYKL